MVLCGKCRATILAGYIYGCLERLDTQPLSPVGELEALKLGRKTYYLVPKFGHVGHRRASKIRAELRPKNDGVVVREHVCGTPKSKYVEAPRRSSSYEYTDEAPF